MDSTTASAHTRGDVSQRTLAQVPRAILAAAPVVQAMRAGGDRGGPHTPSQPAARVILASGQSPANVRALPQREARDAGLSEPPKPQQVPADTPRPAKRRKQEAPPPSEAAGDGGMQKRNTPPAFTADAGIYSRGQKEKGPPPTPSWMAPAQAARYAELIEEWGEHKELTPGDRQLIAIAACVEIELGKLQQFVNEHGPTYLVRGKSGDTYSRARPEYQQLQETRQRLSVLIDKLTNRGPLDRSTDSFIAM